MVLAAEHVPQESLNAENLASASPGMETNHKQIRSLPEERVLCGAGWPVKELQSNYHGTLIA